MPRSTQLTSLLATLVLLAACKKDKPTDDTRNGPSSETKAPASTPTPTPATPSRPPATKTNANAAPVVTDELASAQKVRTVQVAAYPTRSPANWWVQELKRQNIPAYVLESTVNGQTVYRVRIGATLTGAEARSVAEKIHARYQWPTWITMVEDKSVLPNGELSATRAYVAK